jgi:hypothetical protein
MLTSMLLGAAFVAPGAPVPSSADPAPAGPAPWVLYLKVDESQNQRAQIMISKTQKVTQSRAVFENVNGQQVQKIVQEQVERLVNSYVLLDSVNPTLTTAGGMKVSMESLLKRAKTGVVLLISADGKPVSKNWLRAIDSDAIIAVSDSLVSEAAPRSLYASPTTAPRLSLIGTDMKGDAIMPVNPAAKNVNVGYGGRGGQMMMANGQMMFFDDAVGYYSPYQNPSNAEAPVKKLNEVELEAYDLTGKAVSKADAMKRLSAGGFALIAGDNRIPDPAFRDQFRGDLLVLVSNELINVPTGKKKTDGSAPAVRPLPAVKPGVIQALPLRVAPALKVVPAPAPVPEKKEEAPAPRQPKK